MSDERVWLRHKEHGGAWFAPGGAVGAFAEMGWEPGEPLEELNPVVAENLAAQAAAEFYGANATTKTSRKSGADTNQEK